LIPKMMLLPLSVTSLWQHVILSAATITVAASGQVEFGDATASSTPQFAILDDAFGQGETTVRLKVLKNLVTGEYLEVSPDLGGRTEDLVLRSPVTHELQKVLLSHNRNATAAISNVGWKGDILLPYANRVGNNGTYHLYPNKHYQLEPNEDRGCYGKVALHGLIWKKNLRVVSATADDNKARLELAHDFTGEDQGYPFHLSASLVYVLDHEGFTLTFSLQHPRGFGSSPLPISVSWHSYMAVPEIADAVVELDRCSGWNHISVTNNSNIYSDLIPTGATEPFTAFDGTSPIGGAACDPTYWDDEFKATASTTTCPRLTVKVMDKQDATEAKVLWMDSNFRWVQVFTGTRRVFGENGIAVEAMSGQADAFNNDEGLVLLEPGESWQGSIGVKLEPKHIVA